MKVENKTNYTIMDKHFLLDSNLSLAAKGLLAFILAFPEQEFDLLKVIGFSNTNEKEVESLLIELEQAGYINQEY